MHEAANDLDFEKAALLRDESKKIDFWRDLKLIKEKLKELSNGE